MDKIFYNRYDECLRFPLRDLLNFFLNAGEGLIPSIREEDMAKRIARASLLPVIRLDNFGAVDLVCFFIYYNITNFEPIKKRI